MTQKSNDWDLTDYVPEDFGTDEADVVYIKREIINFRPVFSIYDEEGEKIAQVQSRESAIALAHREGFTPQSVN